ncbi:histidine phosphatase family protein [Sinimarinibacterium sp. NLF-5-8]|uniref:SixA phosphatase family protein n=1 Tax=Sinimarinibacterium sp. NLF-5-8 TaxID=2698684 RepID=UPI00137BE49A|nr:histidine phosphatase family protein [Sinimarinibacterium sp. NLF-5-8]QHS09563.1 hypothetical protein GT972_04900 [Sinimarinibacterium sp. NLF-5-8]
MMRTLTLIRHAEAAPAGAVNGDFDRPLTASGQIQAARLAVQLARAVPAPDLLISSPAARAQATAQVFAQAWNIASDKIIQQSAIYEASVTTLLYLLQGIDHSIGHVALVGHNPGISELAHALARCSFGALPTCGVVRIGFADNSAWADLTPACGQQTHYLQPPPLTREF